MDSYCLLVFLLIAILNYCNADIIDHDNNIRRLSGDLKPDFYAIRIHPFFDAPGVTFDPERNQTFDGDVTITTKVVNPTSTIILNAMNLTFPFDNDNIVFSTSNNCMKRIKVDSFLITPENQTITIELERQLRQDENITIQLKYIGQIGDNTECGLFKSTADPEGDTDDEKDEVVYATQFETTGARYVFPSFDEPDYKAHFQLTIVKPKQWVALSNSHNITTADIGNGYEEVLFIKTEIISSYLLAFGIGDLVSVKGYTSDGILTRIWAPRSGKDKLQAALDSAIKCTDVMTKYTNFTLPLLKIDHLAIPSFGGAMENFGLIVYGRQHLIFDPKKDKLQMWLHHTSTICHELSHHWFGDTVTNKWWGDIFLHEGFADFFENKAMALAYPKEKALMDFNFASDNVLELMYNNEIDVIHPIITKNGSFDEITYQMGGAVIRQLEAVITPEVLQKGLQRYIKKYRSSNANYQQLLDEIQSSVDATDLKDWCEEPFNVTSFMNLWLNQKGHPYLNIDYVNRTFLITQHVQNGTDEKLWPLPIFVQFANNQNRLFWSAPNYVCNNGDTLPKTLKIRSSALFINRDTLAVTKAYYSKSAIEVIVDALTSFTTNLQLSPASLYQFFSDIIPVTDIEASTTEHSMKIIENVLMYQRNVFSFGIFEEFTNLIETFLEKGKFNNVIENLRHPNNNVL
uniref:Aminopeptidase n=1 Tax=Panagrolaimus sp. ES5 TaxID=591445 RepID=A0AC34GSD8_9BILA